MRELKILHQWRWYVISVNRDDHKDHVIMGAKGGYDSESEARKAMARLARRIAH